MKKLLGLIMILVYTFTITNYVVHASYMGFSGNDMSENQVTENQIPSCQTMSYCHGVVDHYTYDITNISHTTDANHGNHMIHADNVIDTNDRNIDCCGLFFSHQFFGEKITPKNHLKIAPIYTLPIVPFSSKNLEYIPLSKHKYLSAFSPGQNLRSKYIRFSDLFGIIVSLS